MTKSFLAAGTLALAIASNSPAFGHGMHEHGACGALPGGGRMLQALDLSADQKQKTQDILTAHRPTLAQLAATEKAAKQALADRLLGTGSVTQQDIDALVQQETRALMRERLATALETRNVLTPEQIQKAATIHAGMNYLHAQMRKLRGKQGAD